MLFALFPLVALALVAQAATLPPRGNGQGYFPPTQGGGSLLDNAGDGAGEPLNVIISGLSSSDVLTDSGFLNYVQSLGFSYECLGIHLGDPQSANLGDGNGWVNQTVEYRQDFGNPDLGTCLETLEGGNHLRVYRQNGSNANTGALFLAVSLEENLSDDHTIAPDGYDQGRNAFATSAILGSSINGVRYSATAEAITGLLAPGSAGVNHGISTDGIIVLLTVSST